MNSFTGGLFWEFMSSGGVLPSTKLDNLQNFFRIDPRAKILNEDKLGGVEFKCGSDRDERPFMGLKPQLIGDGMALIQPSLEKCT